MFLKEVLNLILRRKKGKKIKRSFSFLELFRVYDRTVQTTAIYIISTIRKEKNVKVTPMYTRVYSIAGCRYTCLRCVLAKFLLLRTTCASDKFAVIAQISLKGFPLVPHSLFVHLMKTFAQNL